MKKKFPESNKVYLQNNRSNVYPQGNLWSTMNMDFTSNVGVARVTPRLKVGASTADDSDLGCPVAFRYFDTRIWSICNTHIFWNSGLPDSTPWTDDASTGAQTDYQADESDMEVFNGTLVASTTDGLFSKAANSSGTGDWTQRDILNTGSSHVMTYFKRFDRLYYANATDNILSIDPSWVTADPGFDYAINLSPSTSTDYTITSMEPTSQFIWVGTLNNFSRGQTGKIAQWDGISAQILDEYELDNAEGCMALAIDPQHDNPYAMDSNGVLSAFNGTGFSEVGRLPFPFSSLPYNIGDSDNESFIHPNGMYFTKNGTLRVNINNRVNLNSRAVVENMPSGIWEWTKENGFYHASSFSYNPVASSTITDWGQNRISRVGALVSMNIPSTSNSEGTLLAGAEIYTDATTSTAVIAFDNSKNDIQKKGYLVTDWWESDEIADSWTVWWMSNRRFLDATDNITVKVRNIEDAPVEATITWVDTTHFTVANSACDVSQFWTAGTGGEVEILRGVGGGLCAHITNAVLAAGSWTVTIDETATGATTTTATARFQKWIRVFPSGSLASPVNWSQFALPGDSEPRIQVKVCYTFTGNGEFYKSILTSNVDIKSE